MPRMLLSSIFLSLLAGSALCAGAPGQLRKDASGVHPQSMAASYGGARSDSSIPSSPFRNLDFDFKATVSFGSEYVFRGQQRAKHSAQGGVEISTSGFYAGAWAILPTEDRFDAFQTEIDIYGGYGMDLTESVYVDVGVTGYIYNSPQLLFAKKDSIEAYAGFTIDTYLNPSLYGFYDFDTKAKTVETAVEYSLPFGRTDLVLGATGGYTSGRGYDYLYAQTDAEVVYNFNRQASIGIGGHWAISEDHQFLDGLTARNNDTTWYGITLKARK